MVKVYYYFKDSCFSFRYTNTDGLTADALVLKSDFDRAISLLKELREALEHTVHALHEDDQEGVFELIAKAKSETEEFLEECK